MSRKLDNTLSWGVPVKSNKTELDRMGVPKAFKAFNGRTRKHYNFRAGNYFYRLFDQIGAQLTAVNNGLGQSGPVRTYQFK